MERGWQEAHQHTVERDKAVAEKESLEYTSSIAINTARREVRTWQIDVVFRCDDNFLLFMPCEIMRQSSLIVMPAINSFLAISVTPDFCFVKCHNHHIFPCMSKITNLSFLSGPFLEDIKVTISSLHNVFCCQIL